jgi:hypothetical protein
LGSNATRARVVRVCGYDRHSQSPVPEGRFSFADKAVPPAVIARRVMQRDEPLDIGKTRQCPLR